MFEFETLSEGELAKLAQTAISSGSDDVLEDPLSDPLEKPRMLAPVDPHAKMKEFEDHFEHGERSLLKGLSSKGSLPGHDPVNVNAPKGLDGDKMSALQGGVDLVAGLGYDLPEMDVHFAQKGESKVRNVAFMREGEQDKNNLYLSDQKLLAHSKMLGGSEAQYGIKGGLRDAKATGKGIIQSGERGVADQFGDSARNSKGKFNREKKNDAKANKAYGKAVVVHEMGHMLHKAQSPDVFWAMKTTPEVFTGWKDLAMGVSQYATQNALEFVAEVFTGTTLGIGYSSAIMNKYAEFGGPAPKSTKDKAEVTDLDQIPRSHSPETVQGSSKKVDDE